MHETLYDYEAGYKISDKNLGFSFNSFYMDYTNQLVPTGKLNNVGAYIRNNVKKSFRKGIEIEGFTKIKDWDKALKIAI